MSRIPCRDLLEEKTNVTKTTNTGSDSQLRTAAWIHKLKQLMVSSQLALL